jgi:hypothetical protein
LAVPEENSPAGTEKDGELVVSHPKKKSISRDIRLDPGTLWYLKDKTFEKGASAQKRDHVQHRAKGYCFMNNLLGKRTSPTAGRIDKVVPPPKDRVNLIRAFISKLVILESIKPFLLWSRLTSGVLCLRKSARKFRLAKVCDHVKANFEVKDPTLKPLPIMGMFYRWGVDLCNMLFKSVSGNR